MGAYSQAPSFPPEWLLGPATWLSRNQLRDEREAGLIHHDQSGERGQRKPLPNWFPRRRPDICSVPCKLGGVKMPPRTGPPFLNRGTLPGPKASGPRHPVVPNGPAPGAGWRAGKGCVRDSHSPATPSCGTGRSSTGRDRLPRVSIGTNRCPILVAWASAAIRFPSRSTSISDGPEARS